jgi:AraC-like DNA-binding protein
MGATVLSVSSRALIGACARLGLDTSQLLRAAGLDAPTLDDPDARIPVEQLQALWRQAYELSGDPHLALHAIEVLPYGAYRVLDLLGSSAPTVGAALAKVSDYFPLINTAVRLPYAVHGNHVTLAVEAPSHPALISRPYAEYTLAAMFLRTRAATGQRYPLLRVEFVHSRPADVSEHERIFECAVEFGAPRCQLVIARPVWEMPRAGGSDPMLFDVLDTHARMLLDRLPAPTGTGGRVREAIEAELRGGNPRLEVVAKRLAMSPRTLQRRLREEGIVFNDLLDALRFTAAKSYLAQGDIAGAEVAYLLGFAEHSSFNRAFRRWSGQTPTEYRRRIAAV